MRVVAVCESPPSLDGRHGNGSTSITCQVLRRLPDDLDIDLAYFNDRPVPVDARVVERCRSVIRLPMRSAGVALAAQPLSHLPRATWQRSSRSAKRSLTTLAAGADVAYLHGLHTFALGSDLEVPIVANEIDPWSVFWRSRAASRSGSAARYDRLQAERARALEWSMGQKAAAYVLVSDRDATALSEQIDVPVTSVPIGVDIRDFRERDHDAVDPDLVVFVGSLDYAPNITAVDALVADVYPLLRTRRPSTRLLIAGRRPSERVVALAGDGVEVEGDVADVGALFRRAAIAVSLGSQGQGTKNTLLEALASGCPVVASAHSARGLPTGQHLTVVEGTEAAAESIAALLDDTARRRTAGIAARRAATSLPGWDGVAARYASLLRRAAGGMLP